MTDEAEKPKQTRRRRASFPNRIELRVNDAQLDLAERSRSAASVRLGREVSLSELHRSALEDGCKSLIEAIENRPAVDAGSQQQVTASLDSFADEMRLLRDEIRRIGHNANQLTRYAHTKEEMVQLDGVLEALESIDERLVQVAGEAIESLRKGSK